MLVAVKDPAPVINADLVEDRGLLGRYYNSGTLSSDRARRTFILPDRFQDKGKQAA